jgi:hypothetical protein
MSQAPGERATFSVEHAVNRAPGSPAALPIAVSSVQHQGAHIPEHDILCLESEVVMT